MGSSRRNAVRRNRNLDEGQTQEAMKVLERYCRKKYRNSVLVSQNDLDCTNTELLTPLSRPLSSFQFPNRQVTLDRQSTLYSHGLDSRPPLSPGGRTFDFSDPHIKQEIKYDSQTDNLWTYTSRVTKFLYYYLGLKPLIFVIFLVTYALVGGYVFQQIERPQEIAAAETQAIKTEQRHAEYAGLILLQVQKSGCLEKLKNHTHSSTQLENRNSLCSNEILKLLRHYDERIREDRREKEPWDWDYWNAVFYAGTVFTTIGYGNLTCKTNMGRLVTILYALVGIPLMLIIMNIFGVALFDRARKIWMKVRRIVKLQIQQKKKAFIGKKEMQRSMTVESVASADVRDYEKTLEKNAGEEQQEEPVVDEPDIFDSFPMPLAILIVFLFIILCSVVFSVWEEWDWFTSFYFTFISLSTVGFGDVIPQHPKYACVLFFFYFIGLALVSMCIAIIQARVESRYMWALQLIDQEHEEGLEQAIDQDEKETKSVDFDVDVNPNIRFRNDNSSNYLKSPFVAKRMSSMIVSPSGDSHQPTPPVLEVFLTNAMNSKRKSLLVRSESALSQSSTGSRGRQYSRSPSNSELLTPGDGKPKGAWPTTWNAEQTTNTTQLTTRGSSASLAPRATTSAPLSVITEVSDEDTLSSRRSTRKTIPEYLMLQINEDEKDGESRHPFTSSTESEASTTKSNRHKLKRGNAQDLDASMVTMEPEAEVPPPMKPTTLNLSKSNRTCS